MPPIDTPSAFIIGCLAGFIVGVLWVPLRVWWAEFLKDWKLKRRMAEHDRRRRRH